MGIVDDILKEDLVFSYGGETYTKKEITDSLFFKETSSGTNIKNRYEPDYHSKMLESAKTKEWIPTPAERKQIIKYGYDKATELFSTSRGKYQILPETAYRYTSFAGDIEDLDKNDVQEKVKDELLEKWHNETGGDLQKTINRWNQGANYFPTFYQHLKSEKLKKEAPQSSLFDFLLPSAEAADTIVKDAEKPGFFKSWGALLKDAIVNPFSPPPEELVDNLVEASKPETIEKEESNFSRWAKEGFPLTMSKQEPKMVETLVPPGTKNAIGKVEKWFGKMSEEHPYWFKNVPLYGKGKDTVYTTHGMELVKTIGVLASLGIIGAQGIQSVKRSIAFNKSIKEIDNMMSWLPKIEEGLATKGIVLPKDASPLEKLSMLAGISNKYPKSQMGDILKMASMRPAQAIIPYGVGEMVKFGDQIGKIISIAGNEAQILTAAGQQIPVLLSQLQSLKPPTPQITPKKGIVEPLVEEAKKYKTAEEFYFKTGGGKYNLDFIKKMEVAKDVETVGTVGDFIIGKNTRRALGKEVLNTKIIIKQNISDKVSVLGAGGVLKKGSTLGKEGERVILIDNKPSHMKTDIISTILEEAAHTKRAIMGREMRKIDLKKFNLEEYESLPQEISGKKFGKFLHKIKEAKSQLTDIWKKAQVKPIKPKKAVKIAKEAWQMTKDEFFESKRKGSEVLPVKSTKLLHKAEIQKALSEGKTIPSEVLKDYPEIVAKGGGAGGAMIAATGTIGKGGYGTIESSEKAAERAKKGKVAKTDYSKVAEELPVNQFGLMDEALKLVAPAVRRGAQVGKRILRKNIAELAHNDVVAAEALKKAHRAFSWMNRADTLDFIDRMETGQTQKTDKLQKISVMFRDLLDGRRTDIQNLGKGHLESYIENYFPHIWKDPKKAKDVISAIMGKKRLEGTKAFLKKRVIVSVKDGVSRGLELVSDNPVDLVLLKLHEMDRYIMAQQMIQDLKQSGQIKFVYSRSQAPEGYAKVNDNAFTVYMPPEITKKDYFDQIMVDDLMSVAQHLGIDTRRFVSIGGKRVGYAQWFPYRKGGEKVRTKFASPESVLAHEIGHILGVRYNLYDLLGRRNDGEWKVHKKGKKAGQRYFSPSKEAVEYRREIDAQWRALADARAKNIKVPEGFRKYIRSAREKEAVMLEALMHAPEEFKRVAPDLYKAFTTFLNNNAELRPILDIKPSLVLGVNDAKIKVPGFTTLGHYYAVEQVATLLNNYLSPGLRNNKNKIIASGYNMVRGAGNVQNQAQLAGSLFHALNVTSDMAASTLGLGLRRLQVKGQRIRGLTDIALAGVAPITTVWQGQRIRKAYHQQLDTITDPKLRQMVEAVIAAGGRGKMDVFYYNQQLKALEKTFSDIVRGSAFAKIKGTMKLPFNLFGATLESLAKPLMEWYVPTGKMGLFAKLAQHEFQRAEAGQINQEQLWERLTQSWDNVDNRMGQLVYDNLFWNKTLKDILMLAIRSTGWNLGSWREFGGAPLDVATTQERIKRGDVWLSQKMAYTIGAVTIYSVLGAVIQYALTGEPPEEAKDYLFPKTGMKNPDGSDERLSMPTYAKDWYAWSHQPLKTAVHKIHPLWGLLGDLATNEDYFNVEVRHVDDPLLNQAGQFVGHIGESFKTISMKNYEKMQRTAPGDKWRNALVSITGVTSAPAYITRTPAQKLMTRYIIERIPPKTKTEEQFERSMYRKTLKDRIRKGERIDAKEAIDILGSRSYNRMLKEAKMPPFADSYNRLAIREALNVYAIASNEERKQVKTILQSKYRRARPETKTEEIKSLYLELMK